MTDLERYERGQEIVRDVEREFSGRPMAERVEEVRARIEKLVLTDGGSYCSYLMKPVVDEPLLAEPLPVPVPEHAFPDSFYYRPVIIEEPRPVMGPQLWVQPTENFGKRSHADWAPNTQHLAPNTFCQCGHRAEEHLPACCHLIEGCGCEGFLKVPGGVVEGA